MADKDDKKETVGAQNNAANVASLNVASIIAALHQNALGHVNPESKGAFLYNSAIDGKDDKAKIKSAGEHVIGIRPAKEGETIKKKDAVDMLATYVQWFVGPDLAKNVTDSTVKSLKESPTNESKKFMSFKQFMLLEADGDSVPKDIKTDGKDDSSATKGEDDDSKKSEDGGEDKDKDASSNADENIESQLGYYISYNLKVEGLPQTALKDAMKKFAKTFFDDVKITAKGLFGGGDSFTVGDIKKSLRSAFGPIDPDDLVRQVETRVQKLYKGSSQPMVKVQDKDTLISDLGKQIDATERKQISDANYSLFIKVDEHDPKKPIFNTRIVADIVQSSITGIFKKFKNKITKNDVIYIQNYKDTHENAEAIKTLYNAVPTPDQIFEIINKAANANKAHADIEKKLESINKDKQRDNCLRAMKCNAAWINFKKSTSKDSPEDRARITGRNKIDYFQSFKDAYEKAFNGTKDISIDQTVDESMIVLASIDDMVKKIVFESLVEADEETNGDDGKSKEHTYDIDVNQLKTAIDAAIKAYHLDNYIKQTFIGTVDDIKKKLKYYDTTTFMNDFKEYKNGILASSSVDSLAESIVKSILSNDNLKSSIMNILFEKDKEGDGSDKSDKDVNLSSEEIAKKLKSIFINELQEVGITEGDRGDEVIIYKMKTLDESKFISEGITIDGIEDLNKVNAIFNTNVVRIPNKPDKTRKIKTKILPIDGLQEYLDKYGLFDSSALANTSNYKYVALCILKKPAKINGEQAFGTPGFNQYTLDKVTTELLNSAENISKDYKSIEYTKKATKGFDLYLHSENTKEQATCLIYAILFNINSGGSKPGSTKSNNENAAYVFPFGLNATVKPPEDPENPKPKDTYGTGTIGKYDAYIIPMKGLAEEDPEHDNTNIK